MASSEDTLKSVEEYIRVPDQNQTSKETATFMMQAPTKLAPHFMNKVWLLLRTECQRPFLIGDNPLALQDICDMEPYGNIGLGLPGIEIYFPLSPIRALALWSSFHEEMFQKSATNLRFLSQIDPHLVATHVLYPLLIERIVVAMETGSPLTYMAENVLNFNSLQVNYVERCVFSYIDDFVLAREMIERHPHARFGPRAKIN